MYSDNLIADSRQTGVFARIVKAFKGPASLPNAAPAVATNLEADYAKAAAAPAPQGRARILVQRDTRRARREARLG